MTPANLDSILDDLFLGCALQAFVELAIASGQMPCSEATRQRAYQLYKEALSERASKPWPMPNG